MAEKAPTLASAVARFGRTAARKLTEVAVHGEPEDQLRAPLERLVSDLAEVSRRRREHLTLVGETSLADLKTRPDYAVSYVHTLVGFIEVKAPGIGADPRRFKRRHDKDQWAKLRALPNLIYTDGQAFSLWRDGELVGDIVKLEGDLLGDGEVTAPSTLLTDNVLRNDTLATSVATLSRVLAVVDWPTISKGQPDAWLYFYEDFLEVYDNDLRKQTGSYYTPVPVVETMTRLVNEALRDRFGFRDGLANQQVNLVDPAMGTGTFLLEVVRAISQNVADDLGEGAVPAAAAAALWRLVGFELQLGPFAVAQLRLLAELAELGANADQVKPRLFVTNTLGNPFIEEQSLGTWYEPIAQSRREANRIKRDEIVLVVLGNPPYKDKSHGKGGWIESGNPDAGQPAPLDAF